MLGAVGYTSGKHTHAACMCRAPDERLGLGRIRLDRVIEVHRLIDALLVLRVAGVGRLLLIWVGRLMVGNWVRLQCFAWRTLRSCTTRGCCSY